MIPLLMAALATTNGEILLVTAENRQIPVQEIALVEIAGRLSLEFTDAANRKQILPCRDIVEIVFGSANPRKKFAAEDVILTTTTGDTMHGSIATSIDGGVRIATAPFGEIDVRFDQIAVLRFPANRSYWPKDDPAFSGKSDLLVTKSNDRPEGTVRSIDPQRVEYKSKRLGRMQQKPLGEMTLIFFMPPADPPPAAPESLHAIIQTAEGSSVQGTLTEMKAGVLSFRDLRGQTVRVSTAALTGLYFRNGRVVYLSDWTPKADENPNYIRPADGSKLPSDLSYPWQADKSAAGTKLSIRSKEFRKGVGVRAYSSLTYALQGNYRKFQTSIGVDDALQYGDVVFEVWVDGKKIESRPSKSGEPAQEIEIDVTRAAELRLVVDFGGNANVGDFADWASARLIKE